MENETRGNYGFKDETVELRQKITKEAKRILNALSQYNEDSYTVKYIKPLLDDLQYIIAMNPSRDFQRDDYNKIISDINNYISSREGFITQTTSIEKYDNPNFQGEEDSDYEHSEEEIIAELIDFKGMLSDYKKLFVVIIDEKIDKISSLDQKIQDLTLKHETLVSKVSGSELNNLIGDARASFKKIRSFESRMKDQRIGLQERVSYVTDVATNAEDTINKLARGVASTAIARDYIRRAENENDTANRLRIWSLIIMGIAAIVLGTTVFDPIQAIADIANIFRGEETVNISKVTYDPVAAGIRVMFSIFLSVPAAYLARESAKHRVKHNAYEQIAMNIDAVHTLIKPLSDEDKNTILASMANRLFSNPVGVDQSATSDPFPISASELIMKLIDKADFKSASQAVSKPTATDKPASN